MRNSHFFFSKKVFCGILNIGGSMARYRLCISDQNANKFYVPFGRDGKEPKETVDLYEIDMVTISLGKEKLISELKKCNLASPNFDWNRVTGHIEYTYGQEKKYLPLLFERDPLLIQMVNLENKYRYHKGISESRVVNMICETSTHLPDDLKRLLENLTQYRDCFLNEVVQTPELLADRNLSKKLRQQMYSWTQSSTYDERREYANDLLKQMISYMNLRRMKAAQYALYVSDPIVDQPQVIEEDETETPSLPPVDAGITPRTPQ